MKNVYEIDNLFKLKLKNFINDSRAIEIFEKQEKNRKENIRFWATTTISIITLIVAVIALFL